MYEAMFSTTKKTVPIISITTLIINNGRRFCGSSNSSSSRLCNCPASIAACCLSRNLGWKRSITCNGMSYLCFEIRFFYRLPVILCSCSASCKKERANEAFAGLAISYWYICRVLGDFCHGTYHLCFSFPFYLYLTHY